MRVLRDLGGDFETHVACLLGKCRNDISRIEGLGLLDNLEINLPCWDDHAIAKIPRVCRSL